MTARTTIFVTLAAAASMLLSCNARSGYSIPQEPDYSKEISWYTAGNKDAGAAVFYVAPTCIWDWTDSCGNVCHFMNITDSLQRQRTDSAVSLAEKLLGRDCRFYSPYYRQVTMDSWSEDSCEVARRFSIAFGDIRKAFRRFADSISCGRPFILAGHSQGGKCVVELLKSEMTPELYSRMVAAYILGYPVTDEDLKSPYIVPATGSSDIGVIVSFNSAASADAVSPMFRGNRVCINPLNWRCDTTTALPDRDSGPVFFGADGSSDTLFNTISARIDTTSMTVMVDGLRKEDYFIPSIASLFPLGNYHVQELNLYFLEIQDNIRHRLECYGGMTERKDTKTRFQY